MDASDLRLDDFVQQTSELDLSVTPPPSLVTSTVFAVDTTPRAVPRSLELLSSSSNVLGALASAQLGRAHEALSASATATPPSSTSDLQAVAIVSASEARAHTSGKVSASSSTAERHADGGDVQQKEEELRRISKLAQLLGADTDKDIKASRRQLKLLYNNVHNRTDLLSSIDHILSQEKDIAAKHAEKVASILGVQPEVIMKKLMAQSSRRALNSDDEESEDVIPFPSAGSDDTKRITKITKILGINDQSEAAQVFNEAAKIATLISDTDTAIRSELFSRAERKQFTEVTDFAHIPLRLTVSTGQQFTARVFLNGETFKNVQLATSASAGDLTELLVEKLNLGDGDSYEMVERRNGKERILESAEILFEVMSKWSIQDVLIFRKCGELSNTGDDDDDDNIRAKRRVAKVANILGVNESKNMIGGQSAEMRLLAGRLSSGSTSAVTTGSANLFRVDRIVKDGWLQLEVVKGKYEPHWCYIENENFIAVNKSNTATTLSGTVNLVIRGCDITAVENNLCAFEIKHKYGALMFLSDSEEGRDTWVQVLRKCAAKPAKMSVDETDADYDTEFNKKMKQRKTRVSIDDFELKTVLGRGKFGKVLLCKFKDDNRPYAVKVIKKASLTDSKLVEGSQTENFILRTMRHPFMVGLEFAFQDVNRLYLVMDFINGGELFYHLSKKGRFAEEQSCFYGAQILSALQCLHGKGIVYRDLKLENILLDRKGNIKLTDFGLSKREEEVDEKGVYTGTYEYLSPEVILGKSASYAADWWSYAVVLFEMLCGFHPFYAEDRSELFERILYMQIELPDHVGDEAVDLLAQLLVRDPTQRLGCRTEGNKAIQNHPFFADINFDLLFNGKLMAPFKPKLKDDFDWSNFDPEFTHEAPKLTPVQSQAAITTGGCDGAKYANFSYVRPSFIADDKS